MCAYVNKLRCAFKSIKWLHWETMDFCLLTITMKTKTAKQIEIKRKAFMHGEWKTKQKKPTKTDNTKKIREKYCDFFCCARRIESEIQYNSRKKRSCLRKPNYQLNNTCYCGIYSHVHSPSHTAHLIIFSCLLFISLSPAPSLHLSLARSRLIAVSIAISVFTDLFCCSFISFIYSFHTRRLKMVLLVIFCVCLAK